MSAGRISATITSSSTSRPASWKTASTFWPNGCAKIGGTTIRSVGHIAKLQRIKDNDKNYVPAIDMLTELMNDNKAQIQHMRAAHEVADDHEDVATASFLEVFIDEAEKRCWFLFEASRQAERSGH